MLRLYEALTRKLSAFYAVNYFRGRRQRMHIGKSQMHSARLTARAKMFARARGTPQRERERVTCNNNIHFVYSACNKSIEKNWRGV